MMRTLESLAYEVNADAAQAATTMAIAEANAIEAMDAEAREANKNQILEFARALNYLARFEAIAEDHPARVTVNAVVEAQDWKQR
jgi:hypothetical protein